MKNIFKFAAIALLASAAISCQGALEKDEVEAGFAPKQELPVVAISPEVECDAILGIAKVTFTVTRAAGVDGLEVGVISDTDPSFYNSSFTALENPSEGTFTINAKVIPNTTAYIKAVAGCNSGSAYSETITVKVPDVPFFYKVPGNYRNGEVIDYWGDPKAINFDIIADEEDPENVCWIGNFSSYFAGKGYTYDKGVNIYEAAIDNENHTVTIWNYQEVGASDVILYSFDEVGSLDADLVLTFDDNCTSCSTKNWYGFYTAAGGGWYELFSTEAGPIVFTKQ